MKISWDLLRPYTRTPSHHFFFADFFVFSASHFIEEMEGIAEVCRFASVFSNECVSGFGHLSEWSFSNPCISGGVIDVPKQFVSNFVGERLSELHALCLVPTEQPRLQRMGEIWTFSELWIGVRNIQLEKRFWKGNPRAHDEEWGKFQNWILRFGFD